MSGFADLVGRNAPALGVNRATYVAGDTWGDALGAFTDNSGALINLAGATINIVVWDKPGGNALTYAAGTGTNVGTFSFTIANTATAALASGSRRDIAWSCYMQSGGSTVTVWSAVESPLTVLAD